MGYPQGQHHNCCQRQSKRHAPPHIANQMKKNNPIAEATKCPPMICLGCENGTSGAAITRKIEAPNDPMITACPVEKAKKPNTEPAKSAPINAKPNSLGLGLGARSWHWPFNFCKNSIIYSLHQIFIIARFCPKDF